MLGIAAGGLIALQLIPTERYDAAGALTPAALALTVGLCAGPAIATLRSPRAILRCEHMLVFGLFYWLLLDVALGYAQVEVSRAALVHSFAGIILFALALWAGSVTAAVANSPGQAPAPVHDLGPRFLFFAALVSGMLGLSRVLLGCSLSPGCLIEAFSQPRFAAVWFRIDRFGHFDTLFMYSRYFGFLVLPLTAALIAREGRITRRSGLTALLGLICLVYLVGEGGRKDVGTVVGASLLTWALLRQQIRLRHLVGVVAAAAALVLVMQFMLVAREVGIAAAFDANVELRQPRTPIGTVDRNFRYFSSIVQFVPERHPYAGWQGVAYAATVWVPGGLVPREWQRRTIDLPSALKMSVGPRYTWTSSALGDLYLIGGFPVILAGGFLFGVMARLVSGLLTTTTGLGRPVLYALLTMTLFLSLRALHEFFVTGFIVLAFALLLAARHVLLRHANRSPAAERGRGSAPGA